MKHNSLLTNASLIILVLLKYLEMESKGMHFSRDWCEAEQLFRLLLPHYWLPHLPKHTEVYANLITLTEKQLLNTSSSHFVKTANSLLHRQEQETVALFINRICWNLTFLFIQFEVVSAQSTKRIPSEAILLLTSSPFPDPLPWSQPTLLLWAPIFTLHTTGNAHFLKRTMMA